MRANNGYTFAVYLHERGKRPRCVGSTDDLAVAEWEHDGRTYYFATADLTRRTVTFADIKPQAVAETVRRAS